MPRRRRAGCGESRGTCTARGVSRAWTSCSRAEPDVVVIATVHDQLAALAERALQSGAHVLVEKPAGVSSRADRAPASRCQRASGRLVKVGFNHRFHPGIARAAEEVHSGRHGELMYLRARYGHGGRLGYDREWRARAGALGRRRADRPGHAPARPDALARGSAGAAVGAAAHALLGHARGGQRCADPRRCTARARIRGRCCT